MKRIATLLLALCSMGAYAQNHSIATNAAGYANLGTLNTELGIGVSQNFSITAQARYNPWQFEGKDTPFQNKQISYALGARYWPWHVNSSWFFGAKAQYEQYNRGGIRGPVTSEGDAYGLGAYAGWAMMLGKWINLEIGAGFWGGYEEFIRYACPRCGRIVGQGNGGFLRLDDVLLQIAWIF